MMFSGDVCWCFCLVVSFGLICWWLLYLVFVGLCNIRFGLYSGLVWFCIAEVFLVVLMLVFVVYWCRGFVGLWVVRCGICVVICAVWVCCGRFLVATVHILVKVGFGYCGFSLRNWWHCVFSRISRRGALWVGWVVVFLGGCLWCFLVLCLLFLIR